MEARQFKWHIKRELDDKVTEKQHDDDHKKWSPFVDDITQRFLQCSSVHIKQLKPLSLSLKNQSYC